MKYELEERLEIGKQIYNNEISKYDASVKYGISVDTARDYMRMYRDANNLVSKDKTQLGVKMLQASSTSSSTHNLSDYESMTKEDLLQQVIKLRINEQRLKKGYEVKGDGSEKVFLPLDSKNMK